VIISDNGSVDAIFNTRGGSGLPKPGGMATHDDAGDIGTVNRNRQPPAVGGQSLIQ